MNRIDMQQEIVGNCRNLTTNVSGKACNARPLKPILKYPGGKGRELKHILPMIPGDADRFFEPFVGGGATYFSVRTMRQYFINDISKELIATYKAVKSQNPDFIHILSTLNEDWKRLSTFGSIRFDCEAEDLNLASSLIIIKKYGLECFFTDYLLKMRKQKRAYIQKEKEKGNTITEENKSLIFETILKASYYAAARKIYNQNRRMGEIDANAAFYFFMREFCYSSMFRFSQNGDFNVPYGGMSYNAKNFDEKLKYLSSPSLLSHLENTEIYDVDFQTFAEMFTFGEKDFIFVDPPYDTEFSTYDGYEFGRQDQIRLSHFLRSTAAKWLLVIKDTDFIRSLYPKEENGIFYQEIGKKYSVSFMNRNDRKANHLMITNYEV